MTDIKENVIEWITGDEFVSCTLPRCENLWINSHYWCRNSFKTMMGVSIAVYHSKP